MTDDEQFGFGTHTQQQKTLFFGGVFIIEKLNGKFVVEGRFSLVEGDLMLLEVC